MALCKRPNRTDHIPSGPTVEQICAAPHCPCALRSEVLPVGLSRAPGLDPVNARWRRSSRRRKETQGRGRWIGIATLICSS